MSEDDPRRRHRYGDARRPWHPAFVEYMYKIVEHPHYGGMPCTVDDVGKIDWTIPSFRPQGSKNWDGNTRRREWWAEKARELGIPLEGHWISQTAKRLHPYGEKPCQTCGRVMTIGYVYPAVNLISRLNSHLPLDAQINPGDHLTIFEVVDHMAQELGGGAAVTALARVPVLSDLGESSIEHLKEEIHRRLVARESRLLSPGVMSNAPDRLDGFHTYNRCCRGTQDTGRSELNLRSYGADRRAFEHWCEGDWSAANKLMTLASVGACPRCGREEQLTADHVGPISLGFAHFPYFEPACRGCNSAKNNRMGLADVLKLLELEAAGHKVVSWQAKALWDACKNEVKTDADALLLSRLLRINQHFFLTTLHRIKELGLHDVLLQFLSPEHAGCRTEFIGLNPLTLTYSGMQRSSRQETYAQSHASRMVRIAFQALDDYASKLKRNVHPVPRDLLELGLRELDGAIERAQEHHGAWREPLSRILEVDVEAARDPLFAEMFRDSYKPPEDFSYVKEGLEVFFSHLSGVLSLWFHERRYVHVEDAIEQAMEAEEL